MKIPDKNFTVKIGPFIYEVINSDEVANESNVFGSTHNNQQKIFLDPKMKAQNREQTFIHELIHACNFVNGLAYRFDSKDKETLPTEEDVCRELSMVLYQVIEDNPQIFK